MMHKHSKPNISEVITLQSFKIYLKEVSFIVISTGGQADRDNSNAD